MKFIWMSMAASRCFHPGNPRPGSHGKKPASVKLAGFFFNQKFQYMDD